MTLRRRAVWRLAVTLPLIAGLVLGPAGSLRFWQGDLFLVLMAGNYIFFLIYFLRHDPQLLERRMQRKESQPEQRLFQKLWMLVSLPAYIVAGLDFRFGWSKAWLGRVPTAVIIAGQAAAVAAYWLVFWVMKTNSFAASTIQVEQGQNVVATGPYAMVRHPMYFGMILMMLGTPLALGSYVALPLFALAIPVLVYRLIHEERVLRQELVGYSEYCERIRYRLLPGVW